MRKTQAADCDAGVVLASRQSGVGVVAGEAAQHRDVEALLDDLRQQSGKQLTGGYHVGIEGLANENDALHRTCLAGAGPRTLLEGAVC
jgi:hypothetical protein